MTTEEEKSVLTSSAVMAAGTVVSRLSGFVRGALLAAALGNGLHADLFNIANTIPNMLYILLAGGVFNAVLVPQLVRSMKRDDDGGAAYANRIITLAALFLGAVSLVLVVAAPLVMRLFLDPVFYTDALSAERDSAIAFARYCLPQVFFYGMFVLVGQVLNARGSFGPMMWAPIANNVVSVAILVAYLAIYGTAAPCAGGYSPDQELLLGLGSTLGIAVQLLVLLPYLRRAGFHYRARYDFRHTGLGHTLRLGLWTVLFVVVNQIAYTVVVRLSSTGTASAGAACGAAPGHGAAATGYTVYSQTFLIMMVPHSVVTVSLATAILPALSRKAADADLRGVARSLTSALRTALAVVLPFAALLPLVARDVSHLIWGYGSASRTFVLFAPSLALFGPGLVFFTVHYLILRGFYALERTRTVFFIQCAVAATNIVLAVALVNATDAEHTSPALVVAYAASYAVGSAVSYVVLRRLLGGLETPRLVRFLVRMAVVVGVSTLAAGVVAVVLHEVLPSGGPSSAESWTVALVRLVVVSGVDGVVFLALARALRVDEITSVTEMITRRLPGRAAR